jgi:hypothetical protein
MVAIMDSLLSESPSFVTDPIRLKTGTGRPWRFSREGEAVFVVSRLKERAVVLYARTDYR